MTLPSLIDRIDYLKSRTAAIRQHEACAEIHWLIPDLEPAVILEAATHFGLQWFRCADMVAVLLWDSQGGYHIQVRSYPVQIREMFEFIKPI